MKRKMSLLLALALAAPGVHAGDPPGAAHNTPAVSSTQTAAVAASGPSLSDSATDQTLMELRNLEKAAALAQARLNLQQLQQQLGQGPNAANRPPGAMPPPLRATAGEPLLVGMISGRTGQRAEFIADGALVRVREGDWISPEWRVSKLLPNGAVIAKRNGRRKTVLFGGSEDLATN